MDMPMPVKLLVLLLICALLTTQIGCTAIGYGVGKAIDKNNAKRTEIDLVQDSSLVGSGQMVVVTTATNAVHRGRVSDIVWHERLSIQWKMSMFETFTLTFGWNQIKYLETVGKPSVKNRVILGAVGLMIDAMIVSSLIDSIPIDVSPDFGSFD